MDEKRASLGFGDQLDDIDITDFKPKKAKKTATPKINLAEAAEKSGFKSRDVSEQPAKKTKSQRRRRTGRNAQFNIKAKPETIEAFMKIADDNDWGFGETLEKAVELLEANSTSS